MDERTQDLCDRWLDGVLDDAGVAELEMTLSGSDQDRRDFWDRAAFHGLLREAAKMRYAADPAPVVPARGSPAASWLTGAKVAVAVAVIAGAGVVSAVTTMAWSYANPRVGGSVVHEEGFESPPDPLPDNLPLGPGVWSGDETLVVAAERGISPSGGAKMLRFASSHPAVWDYEGEASEVWRVIDVAALGDAGCRAGATLELSAVFNGVPVDDGTIPAAGVAIIATDTDPATLRKAWLAEFYRPEALAGNVATARTEGVLDTDVGTWQRLSATITLPPGARYVILHCHVEGRPPRAVQLWQPTGQYVDDIRLTCAAPREPVAVGMRARKAKEGGP